jgi:CII-binding regulator of phage lambda lysogenization HflD
VQTAVNAYRNKSYECRNQAVTAINSQLIKLKKEKERLRLQISSLPESERLFAEVQMGDLIDFLYSDVISDLKKKKRQHSKGF